jgi:hypothetical protein
LDGVQDDSIIGTIRRFFSRSQSDPFYAVIAYRNFKPIYDEREGDCIRLTPDGECLADASFDSP